MKAQNYHARLKTKLSAKEALKKINQVATWWGKQVKGRPRKLHEAFTICFGETWVNFRVTELDVGKKAVWEVNDSFVASLKDKTEWTGTRLIWELTENKSGTQIDFTHAGLTPKLECYDMCRKGWNFHLKKSLLQFLNTGKGLPEQG